MAIRFHSTAFRYGVGSARAIFVIEHCQAPRYSDRSDEQDLVLFLGIDARGVPLEVVAVELAAGDLLVIHAMKMRRRYREALERGEV